MRDPDITGVAAKAWLRPPDAPDRKASLAAWLVEGVGFHPWWHQWTVSVIHLRDEPGLPPARHAFPGSAYELLMVAVDPDYPLTVESWDTNGPIRYLTPVDQSVQWAEGDDAQAVEVGALAVRTICHGGASPDSDWRSWWAAAVKATLEHRATGGTHMPPMPEGRA